MWSARQEATKTMWSGTKQITWSNYVVGGENNISFLPPQVLYFNSYSSGCQGHLKIKITTQNLIRSKQRKSPEENLQNSRANIIITIAKNVDLWYNETVLFAPWNKWR